MNDIDRRLANRIKKTETAIAGMTDEITDLKNNTGDPVRCTVRRATAQAIGHAAFEWVEFDAVVTDDNGMWDENDPTKVGCPADGAYISTMNIGFVANNAGMRRADIVHTSGVSSAVVATAAVPAVQGSQTVFSLTGAVDLQKGDYLRVRVYQSSGGNLNIDANITNRFSVVASQGEKGEQGEKGARGLQGIQGIQGIQGEQGEQGEPGGIITVDTDVMITYINTNILGGAS